MLPKSLITRWPHDHPSFVHFLALSTELYHHNKLTSCGLAIEKRTLEPDSISFGITIKNRQSLQSLLVSCHSLVCKIHKIKSLGCIQIMKSRAIKWRMRNNGDATSSSLWRALWSFGCSNTWSGRSKLLWFELSACCYWFGLWFHEVFEGVTRGLIAWSVASSGFMSCCVYCRCSSCTIELMALGLGVWFDTK